MSETVVIQGSAQAIDPDDVLITVGGREMAGWKTVRITAGMELCPRSFEMQVTELYPEKPDQMVVRPGEECSVFIGKDRVLTGFVNRYSASITARGHAVSIIGRGACQDLVDCAGEWPGQQIVSASVLEVAQKLAEPFGITVRGESGPAVGKGGNTIIPQLILMLGETAWEVIERLCRIAGLLPYELADGSLLIASNPGSVPETVIRGVAGQEKVAASGFQEGVNVLEASVIFSDDQRFSHYKAYRFAFDPVLELGEAGNLIATAKDLGVQRYRPRVLIAEMGHSLGVQNAQDRAAWEAARRWGRGRAVRLTTDAWRDAAGRLYEPNTLAPLDLPTLKIEGVLWLISEVTYRKDQGGTLCDLVLMPVESFGVQPTLPAFAIPAEVAQLPNNLGAR